MSLEIGAKGVGQGPDAVQAGHGGIPDITMIAEKTV